MPAAAEGSEQRLIVGHPGSLAAFFAALDQLERHKGGPVRILQLGDSHTAGDVMTARLRFLFQERFGDAGRGMMPVGLPYNGVRQVEVHVTQAGKWQYHNSLTHPDDGPYGLSGFRATSRSAGASLTIEAVDPAGFDRVEVEALDNPDGGLLDVELDGVRQRRVLTSGTQRLNRIAIDVPPQSHQLRLVAEDRRSVELLAWTIERRTPGVVFDSLGVSSATVALPQHWTPSIVADELRHLDPSLIVLAYGTNEAFEPGFDPSKYPGTVADTLALLRRGAPHASILMIGPPDTERLSPGCRPATGSQTLCVALAASDRGSSCGWETPETLGVVRNTERSQAKAAGAAFWDWSAIMGDGACAMHRWVTADPPLARADHVHMTLAGYDRTADALFADLMEHYAAYRQSEARRPSPRPRP